MLDCMDTVSKEAVSDLFTRVNIPKFTCPQVTFSARIGVLEPVFRLSEKACYVSSTHI
jgi:hypothetical protein